MWFWVLGALSLVSEARSLPLKLSPLQMLCERMCMHTIGAEVLNVAFPVCHPFRHPEMTNVDMALGSGPTSLY